VTPCPARVSFRADPELAGFWYRTLRACRDVHRRTMNDWECVQMLIDAFFETHGAEQRGYRPVHQRVFER
jgi:hypothetical protein